MSRLSKIVKNRILRRSEKFDALMRHIDNRIRHPAPVTLTKNEDKVTPKRM